MSTIKDVTALVDVIGVGDLVKLGVSLAEKGVDAGGKLVAKKTEERESLIEIAEVHSTEYRVKLEDAKRWLEEDGLKAEAVIVKPDIIYKDCIDLEIVATNFKLNQKVKPGTRIILKYVTIEVIEASQQLFEESEKLRIASEEKKLAQDEEKAKKKAEQNIKNKQKLDETVSSVKDGLTDVVANAQKGIGGVFSKIGKKESTKVENDTSDNQGDSE